MLQVQIQIQIMSKAKTAAIEEFAEQMWQVPYADVFKRFNVLPFTFGEANKKQGHVVEENAPEIGRKCVTIRGDLAVNNYLMIPNLDLGSGSNIKSLQLLGRYLYLQGKSLSQSSPFTFHFDLKMVGLSKIIRITASNLFKNLDVQNDFVIQVPLNLDVNRWTVMVFDIYQLLLLSGILPADYLIANSHEVKQITLTSSCSVRGIFTSDDLYDFVTLPTEMRFKFSFDISKWPQHFAWLELPEDVMHAKDHALQRSEQTKAKAALVTNNKGNVLTQQEKELMEQEITQILQQDNQRKVDESFGTKVTQKKRQTTDNSQYESAGLTSPGEGQMSVTSYKMSNGKAGGLNLSEFQNGYFIGQEQRKSELLMKEPVLELKRIIGYSPSSCLSLKWSSKRIGNYTENVVLYTSAATLIAMDADTNVQKRFFFGHTEPICCFDISPNGRYVASAQQQTKSASGNQSIIRIWDYDNANCRSILTMPLEFLKYVAFSHDNNFLAVVGIERTHFKSKGDEKHRDKLIILIWDISKIGNHGVKPEIFAKQTSEFDIQRLKFCPNDSSRLVSCGKQNIRFWKIKDTRNIRGSPVVLGHHSRDPDAVFTDLDFGCRKQPGENEVIKHIYVSSTSGCIYQIGYDSELLEQTYKNISVPILSIAVNEFFCATGSQDNFLRVQPLDFSDFTVTATHEAAAVCSVEISPDGLRVLWGTVRGDLLIFDKSNSALKIIMHSHTNSVVSMDVHHKTGNIITASKDYSIRIWDQKTQIYEYSCTQSNDHPLCLAAHPEHAIFSCGFESGALRVFDFDHIDQKESKENLAVGLEFLEFKKPIKKLAYSPNGELLIACCIDGSVSFHNANRQHLPMKKLMLDFPPENVHVAFSPITRSKKVRVLKDEHQYSSTQFINDLPDENIDTSNSADLEIAYQTVDQTESLFGLMGEHGNNVMIYDTESYILRNQIQAGHILKLFQFASSTEIILVTMDQKIKFFNLAKFEGVFLREIASVHRGQIMSTSISENRGYLLTGGEDNLLKIWDYQAQKAVPYWFQSYIGHTKPIINAFFNPLDRRQIFSTADIDGIFIWDFNGDTETNFMPAAEQDGQRFLQDKSVLHQLTTLERMREAVKDKKRVKLGEFCFYVQAMEPIAKQENLEYNIRIETQPTNDEIQAYIDFERAEKKLPYTHFISVKEHLKMDDIKLQSTDQSQPLMGKKAEVNLTPIVLGGYDGFSGTHENLLWIVRDGVIIYTMNNKIIVENTKTREQSIIIQSQVRLSTMAIYEEKDISGKVNKTMIAVAEGEANLKGQSQIYLLEVVKPALGSTLISLASVAKLSGHTRGIQSLAFHKDKFLISLSVDEERRVAVWSTKTFNQLVSMELEGPGGNMVVVDPTSNEELLIFYVLGSQGLFYKYVFDVENESMKATNCLKANQVAQLQNTDFVCGVFTHPFGAEHKYASIMIIGTDDGNLMAFNNSTQELMGNGKKFQIVENGQIGSIKLNKECKDPSQDFVIIATHLGQILRYKLTSNIFPGHSQNDKISSINLEGGITAMEFDPSLNEGIVGTSQGFLYYVNLNETTALKIVSRINPTIDSPAICQFDSSNPQFFMCTTGTRKGDIKLFSGKMIDELKKFEQKGCGKVVFIETFKKNRQLIGYTDGSIKLMEFKNFEVLGIFKFELLKGEELSAATWCPNTINFAVGTSFGAVFLCAYKPLTGKSSSQLGVKATRLSEVSRPGDCSAVTSILLSSFDPDGSMVVAFANGEIRTWQTSLKPEVFKALAGKQKNYDLDDLQDFIFNVKDQFDVREEPEAEYNQTSKDFDSMESNSNRCLISFEPQTTSKYNSYLALHSNMKCIFIRNSFYKTTKVVKLGYQPISMDCLSTRGAMSNYITSSGNFNALMIIGTLEGVVLLYYLSDKKDKLYGKSQPGQMFGEVTAVAIRKDNGELAVALSSHGEILSFDVLETLKANAEE